MSTTNLGAQSVTYRYRHPTNAESFNKYMARVIQDGIYSGGLLSAPVSTTLRIAPFTIAVRTSSGQLIKIDTTSDIDSDLTIGTPPIPVTSIAPFVCSNFTWVNSETTYLDFYAKALGSIASNDIVFGEVIFTGANITSFSYTYKTWGTIDQDGNLFGNNLVLPKDAPIDLDKIGNGVVLTGASAGGCAKLYVDKVEKYLPVSATPESYEELEQRMKDYATEQAIIYG